MAARRHLASPLFIVIPAARQTVCDDSWWRPALLLGLAAAIYSLMILVSAIITAVVWIWLLPLEA